MLRIVYICACRQHRALLLCRRGAVCAGRRRGGPAVLAVHDRLSDEHTARESRPYSCIIPVENPYGGSLLQPYSCSPGG